MAELIDFGGVYSNLFHSIQCSAAIDRFTYGLLFASPFA